MTHSLSRMETTIFALSAGVSCAHGTTWCAKAAESTRLAEAPARASAPPSALALGSTAAPPECGAPPSIANRAGPRRRGTPPGGGGGALGGALRRCQDGAFDMPRRLVILEVDLVPVAAYRVVQKAAE
eukprot:scaffold4926_cov57-Phaeocystis_antarctica.AAC.2